MREYHPEISTAHERATQDDPWIMYLIVRKDWAGSREELLTMAARAAVQAEAQLLEQEREAFDAWWAQSFRKVVLRADEKQWEQAASEIPSVINGAVIACAPLLRSQRPKLLTKLQALQDLPLEVASQSACHFGLNFYVLKDISLGKQMAQIAHAAMKLAVQQQVPFNRVALMPMRVLYVDDPSLIVSTVDPEKLTVINDAGLTEVESGTLTTAAVFVDVE